MTHICVANPSISLIGTGGRPTKQCQAKMSKLVRHYLIKCNAACSVPTHYKLQKTWWRHQMETFSALLAICAGNSPVPVNSPHKGQWRGALMFTLICARINDWVKNPEAGDLRRHLDHYDVSVMNLTMPSAKWRPFCLNLIALMHRVVWGKKCLCPIFRVSTLHRGNENTGHSIPIYWQLNMMTYFCRWHSEIYFRGWKNCIVISVSL